MKPLSPFLLHTVEKALEQFRGVGRAELQPYNVTPLGWSEGGSWTVQVNFGADDDAEVLNLIYSGDLDSGVTSAAAPSLHNQHVTQDASLHLPPYQVIRRPYLPNLVSVSSIIRDAQKFGSDRLSLSYQVHNFMSQAVESLISIHAAGQVHGDLRPEKFGFTEDGRLVVRDVGIKRRGPYKDPEYVAPEVLRGGAVTANSDIFSFLRVARSLLQPFRADREHQELAELAERVSWTQDYFYPKPIRPAAVQLRDVVLAGEVNMSMMLDTFLDGYLDARRRSIPGRRAKSPTLLDLQSAIARNPETSFAVTNGTGARLAEWFALARTSPKSYDVLIERANRFSNESSLREPQDFAGGEFPRELDANWLDSLHSMMFGFPIDPDHDERLSHPTLAELEQKASFEQLVAGATEVRQTLLNDNSFYSTREVLELLSQPGRPILERDDVLVLRRWGHILAVADHGRCLYPTFQFSGGTTTPVVHRVHERLREVRRSMVNPWSELSFWSVRREALGGLSLKEAFRQERLRHQVNDVLDNAVL